MPTGGASTGGASAGSVRAGEAYVEAFLKDNKLVRGLEGVRRRLNAFGSFMMGIGTKAAAAGALIAAPLLAAVNHFTKTGDVVQKAAIRTGFSTEAISELGYAAEQSGANLEMMANGLKFMARFTDAVKEGTAEATDRLDEFGISTQEFLAASPEQRFEMLADGIAGIKDESLRAAAAMDIFGRSGDMLIPLLEGGAQGVRSLRMEAKQLGLSISRKEADEAAAFGDAWNRVKKATMGGVFALGSSLVPGLMLVVDLMQKGAVAVGDFLRENKVLGVILGGVAAGLFLAGGAAIALGVAMKGLALGVGIVTTAFTILGAVIGFLLSPIGLVVAAIAGISALFLTQTEAGKRFAGDVGESFKNVADTAKFAWGGIVAAIKKGDLELAAGIAMAALRLAWSETILWLTEKWVWFKKTFRDGWADLGTGIRLIWNNVTAAIAKALSWVLDKALWLFRNTIGLIFDGLAWAARKLGADDTAKTMAEIGNIRFDSPQIQGEIEADRARRENEILDEAAKAQRERDAFRQQQIDNAVADVKAARAELQQLVARAKEQPGGAIPGAKPAESDSADRMRRLQEGLAEATKGMFQAPNWKQALGLGDKIQQKQLDVQKGMLKGINKMNDKLDDVQPMRIR